MAQQIHALAATEPKGKLEAFAYDPGELGPNQIEIKVDYCGICHSDLSMLNNEWGMTMYPFVPGHEVAGTVVAVGSQVPGLQNAVGDPMGKSVGLGWFSATCMGCTPMPFGKSEPLCGSRADDCRPPRRVCDPCAVSLGVGDTVAPGC